jgi:hypothetical protein
LKKRNVHDEYPFQNSKRWKIISLEACLFGIKGPIGGLVTVLESRMKSFSIAYDVIEATVNDVTGEGIILQDQADIYCAVIQHTLNHPNSYVLQVHSRKVFDEDEDIDFMPSEEENESEDDDESDQEEGFNDDEVNNLVEEQQQHEQATQEVKDEGEADKMDITK